MPRTRIVPLALAALLAVALAPEASAQSRRGQRDRPDRAPEVGQEAPRLKLVQLTEHGEPTKKKVDLGEYRGKQPVVLIFGSYT